MASGYVTSDGKDLDSRYLGKAEKAASAGYADSAGHANSVAWSGVSGKPAYRLRCPSGNAVSIGRTSLPWSAPTNCFLIGGTFSRVSGTNRIYVNGVEVYSAAPDDSFSISFHMFLLAGDRITAGGNNKIESLSYYPYQIV